MIAFWLLLGFFFCSLVIRRVSEPFSQYVVGDADIFFSPPQFKIEGGLQPLVNNSAHKHSLLLFSGVFFLHFRRWYLLPLMLFKAFSGRMVCFWGWNPLFIMDSYWNNHPLKNPMVCRTEFITVLTNLLAVVQDIPRVFFHRLRWVIRLKLFPSYYRLSGNSYLFGCPSHFGG